MITLTISKATPSGNSFRGVHWSRIHRLRAEWGWLVVEALKRAGVHERPLYAKATLTLERHGSRILDADNARASFKVLIDQLVASGIILDDNPEVIGEPRLLQFQVSPKERKTVIRIEQG